MQFSELICARYSVRGYKPDPVPDEALQQVLGAAQLAPTANNQQPFRLIVIHTRGREAELSRIYHRPWFVEAPIIICACALPAESWVRRDDKDYRQVDVAIVMDHLILAATDLGLGTCWIAAFDEAAAREVLNIPDDVEPVVFTPLGYPDAERSDRPRRPLRELVYYDLWGK